MASWEATTPDGRELKVVDVTAFKELFLRCEVCRETFDLEERTPKVLACVHTFSLTCLNQIFQHANPHDANPQDEATGVLKCPKCRLELSLTYESIQNLPNDHKVFQLMDYILNIPRAQPSQPESPDSEDMLKKSFMYLDKMYQTSKKMYSTLENLPKIKIKLVQQIREQFNQYKSLLNSRQEYLISRVNKIISNHKTNVHQQYSNLGDHLMELDKLYQQLLASKSINDKISCERICQQMQDREEIFREISLTDDYRLFNSCKFSDINENKFVSVLSILGEVKSIVDPDLKLACMVNEIQDLELDIQSRDLSSPEQGASGLSCKLWLSFGQFHYQDLLISYTKSIQFKKIFQKIFERKCIYCVAPKLNDRVVQIGSPVYIRQERAQWPKRCPA